MAALIFAGRTASPRRPGQPSTDRSAALACPGPQSRACRTPASSAVPARFAVYARSIASMTSVTATQAGTEGEARSDRGSSKGGISLGSPALAVGFRTFETCQPAIDRRGRCGCRGPFHV